MKLSCLAAAMLLTVGANNSDAARPSSVFASVDHLAIHVADQDASVAFYQGAFGLAELETPVEGPRWFDLGGGAALHIIPGRAGPLLISKSTHLALRVGRIEQVTDYLRQHDIPWQDWDGRPGAITLRADGVRQIYVRDPDGYWLEVNQPAP